MESLHAAISAPVTGHVRVRTVSLPTFMREAGITAIDLLKLDIEGAEVAVLKNLPGECLERIKQITVEFHDFEFTEHGKELPIIDELLKEKGFAKIKFSVRSNMDVLYINRRDFDISPSDAILLRTERAMRVLAQHLRRNQHLSLA